MQNEIYPWLNQAKKIHFLEKKNSELIVVTSEKKKKTPTASLIRRKNAIQSLNRDVLHFCR